MVADAAGKHGVRATCLTSTDAPGPLDGNPPGGACAGRDVQCSPACTDEYKGSLASFWAEWENNPTRRSLDSLGIQCPCGNGG
jgi:hypothetical protein